MSRKAVERSRGTQHLSQEQLKCPGPKAGREGAAAGRGAHGPPAFEGSRQARSGSSVAAAPLQGRCLRGVLLLAPAPLNPPALENPLAPSEGPEAPGLALSSPALRNPDAKLGVAGGLPELGFLWAEWGSLASGAQSWGAGSEPLLTQDISAPSSPHRPLHPVASARSRVVGPPP